MASRAAIDAMASMNEDFIKPWRPSDVGDGDPRDPAYLTESFIRTRDFIDSPGLVMGAYPCESVVEVVMPKGKIPHHLPGTNEFLTEFPDRYGIPTEAAMGGAETMYPEYELKLKTLPKPPPLKKK